MNTFKLIASALLSSTIVSGCVGTYVSQQDLNSFTEKFDTKRTVNSKLGQPNAYVDINKEFGNNFRDIIHTYDLYMYEFSLNENNYPKKVTVFVYYGSDNILVEGSQFTCFSKDECDNDFSSIVSKYASDDQRKIEAEIKKRRDFQEKQAYMARLEEQRRQTMIREQRLKQSKTSPEIVRVTSPSNRQNTQVQKPSGVKQTTKSNVLD